MSLSQSPLTPVRFAEMLRLLADKRIHGRIAKSVVEAVFAEDKDPGVIIREKGWSRSPTLRRSAATSKKSWPPIRQQ